MTDGIKIFRYEVPVDDRWHEVESGDVLHVAARQPDRVEFWAFADGPTTRRRWLRVYGTGQPITDGIWAHLGTAMAADGRLVWHLLEANWVEGKIEGRSDAE
jgi:hypothetical protein